MGGNSLGTYVGQKDNRPRGARPHVLDCTSSVSRHDMDVSGLSHVELRVRSSLDYTGLFARLCVVERSSGRLNLCDGMIRLAPDRAAAERRDLGALCVAPP